MASSSIAGQEVSTSWADEEIVSRILQGDIHLFEIIMRRYNTRLYRVAFSVLRDEVEAEDVMEDAYVRAYQHLNQFAGRAKFSTWLTRICLNEALMRKRRKARHPALELDNEENGLLESLASTLPDPEESSSQEELKTFLEKLILALPDNYRTVVTMCDIQEMELAEVAECLGITESNVKIRLYRARAALRRKFPRTLENDAPPPFLFPAEQCARLISSVLRRLRNLQAVPSLRV